MRFSECAPGMIAKLRSVDGPIQVRILGRVLKTESVDVVPVVWTWSGYAEVGNILRVTYQDLRW
jgi:hypothetical protein